MKGKRCPYCGKRISYFSAFASRKKSIMTCPRCGKNSKVHISNKVWAVFAVFVLMALAIMAVCIFAKMLNNALSIAFVASPLLIFMLMTPMFVSYDPLKKYKTSMEARKAGIEYADNLTADEFEINEPVITFPSAKSVGTRDTEADSDTSKFSINADVFNKIRAERNAARLEINSDNGNDTKVVADVEKKNYVPVINDVSENHISTGARLKKIHSDSAQYSVRRTGHYIPDSKADEREVKKDERHRTNGNRYSANRKF